MWYEILFVQIEYQYDKYVFLFCWKNCSENNNVIVLLFEIETQHIRGGKIKPQNSAFLCKFEPSITGHVCVNWQLCDFGVNSCKRTTIYSYCVILPFSSLKLGLGHSELWKCEVNASDILEGAAILFDLAF